MSTELYKRLKLDSRYSTVRFKVKTSAKNSLLTSIDMPAFHLRHFPAYSHRLENRAVEVPQVCPQPLAEEESNVLALNSSIRTPSASSSASFSVLESPVLLVSMASALLTLD